MIKGFSSENTKTIDKQRYSSIQPIGSGKNCQDVITKSIFQVNNTVYTISDIELKGVKANRQMTLVGLGTDSRVGDVVRFISGLGDRMEIAIVEVVDADTVVFGHDDKDRIQVGDTVELFRHNTLTLDQDGSLNVSVTGSGPVQFVNDGVDIEVGIDSADPANNNPLPSGTYIKVDGVNQAIEKVTGNPSETVAMPVEIVAADGTEINITAGDINVQLTDQGANADVTRIGDGTNQLGMTANNEAKVFDEQTHLKLDALNTDGAKESKQDDMITELQEIEAELVTLNAEKATEDKQDDTITELQEIEAEIVILNAKVATEAKQDAAITELQEIEAELVTLNLEKATQAKQDDIITELQAIAASVATEIDIVEDFYVQDFSSVPISNTYITARLLTSDIKVMKVLNNSGAKLVLRTSPTGKEMVVGQGADITLQAKGVAGSTIEIKGLDPLTINEGIVYINFEG